MSAATPKPELVSIVSASGWWVLTARTFALEDGDSYRGTNREPVAAWGHVKDEDGWHVVALVTGDSYTLAEPSAPKDSEFYLWHDGQSWCHCRRYWHDPHTTDDITWCRKCAGVIEQAT